MLNIDTYLEYAIPERFELMKLTEFASENNYILYNNVSSYDNSITFVFIELFSIDDRKTVIKINEDLYLILLLEKKLADYVIEKLKREVDKNDQTKI